MLRTAALRNGRDPTPDALRGLAALAVATFHMSVGAGLLASTDPVARLGSWGFLGVDAFFVISGFVIPLSLLRVAPRLDRAPGFLARRYLRVGVPYLAAAVATLALSWGSARYYPGFHGNPPQAPSVATVGCHVIYTCDLVGIPWINVIFWTLAIEFQYYILVAVVLPILVRLETVTASALVAVLVTSALWSPGTLVFAYLPLFAIGSIALAYTRTRLGPGATSLALGVTTGILFWRSGLASALVGLVTGVMLARASWSWRPLLSLGAISYSLYLVHVPTGGRLMNLAGRFHPSRGWVYVMILLALLVSLGAAWIFNRLVEAPCLSASRRWMRDGG